MTAREYLRQLPRINHHIEILTEEIERRRAALEFTAAPVLGDRVQTSPGGDRFADAIAALADKDIQLEELRYIYGTLRERMLCQICRLPNTLQADILRLKYAEEMNLDDIADTLHYSAGYIRQMHTAALVSFEERFNDDMVEI